MTNWQRFNLEGGRLVGAPALSWANLDASIYAVGLAVRVVGAGLVLVSGGLLITSVAVYAPQLGQLVGIVWGALLYLSAVLIYPSWGKGIVFHLWYVITMGLFLQTTLSDALTVGLSPSSAWLRFVPCFSSGLGAALALWTLDYLGRVITKAIEPKPLVWGSRVWARQMVLRIRYPYGRGWVGYFTRRRLARSAHESA